MDIKLYNGKDTIQNTKNIFSLVSFNQKLATTRRNPIKLRLLCIFTRVQVLREPESWSKSFFFTVFNFLVDFRCFSLIFQLKMLGPFWQLIAMEG